MRTGTHSPVFSSFSTEAFWKSPSAFIPQQPPPSPDAPQIAPPPWPAPFPSAFARERLYWVNPQRPPAPALQVCLSPHGVYRETRPLLSSNSVTEPEPFGKR